MRNVRGPIATLVFSLSLVLVAGTASASNISGTISATLTITEDSQLVGDVTCTVTGAACITFGTSGIALKLNGFAGSREQDLLSEVGSETHGDTPRRRERGSREESGEVDDGEAIREVAYVRLQPEAVRRGLHDDEADGCVQ